MSKKIRKELDRLIDCELRFQGLKVLKNEYDDDFHISCGINIGYSRAIKLIKENKKFKESLSDLLLNNEIS